MCACGISKPCDGTCTCGCSHTIEETILDYYDVFDSYTHVLSRGKNHKLTYESTGWRWKAFYLWINKSMIHFSFHPTELDLGFSIHKDQIGLGLSFISLHFDWWK